MRNEYIFNRVATVVFAMMFLLITVQVFRTETVEGSCCQPFADSKNSIEVTQDVVESGIYCEWGELYITQADYELLCRTTYCEAGNQPQETQIMVALTILNRLASGRFGKDMTSVVYAPNAYEVTEWVNFSSRTWNSRTQQAVDIALQTNNHPRNMYYFRTLHFHNFGKSYKKSNDLWFSTEN